MSSYRMPTVGFYCEVEPLQYGETALYDAAAAYAALPATLKQTCHDYSFYYEMWTKPLHNHLPLWAYRWLVVMPSSILANQPFDFQPLLVRAPQSGDICLQWFGFGERRNEHAATAFMRKYPDREVVPCSDYYGRMYVRPNKAGVPARLHEQLSTAEEEAIAEALCTRMSLVEWRQGDLCLLDNIRWLHGRATREEWGGCLWWAVFILRGYNHAPLRSLR